MLARRVASESLMIRMKSAGNQLALMKKVHPLFFTNIVSTTVLLQSAVPN